jgi:hypothetical protein
VFSDGGMSNASASTASLNPVQTIGIREVSQALLSNGDVRAVYTTAVNNLDRSKARSHIRGFLKDYGRGLLNETFGNSLEIQAAKFVIELAGRIADEISWNIIGLEEPARLPKTRLERKDLEAWLSTSQGGRNVTNEEPDASAMNRNIDELFDEGESDEEPDNNFSFPNIDKVRDFLLTSEALQAHVKAMRVWLKMDEGKRRDVEKSIEEDADHLDVMESIGEAMSHPIPSKTLQKQMDRSERRDVEKSVGEGTDHFDVAESTEETPEDLIEPGAHQRESNRGRDVPAETDTHLQQDAPQELEPRVRPRQHGSSFQDLVSGLFEFWGISFFFYDLVELFLPSVPRGYRRLRWRCVSCCIPSPACCATRADRPSRAILSFGATFQPKTKQHLRN